MTSHAYLKDSAVCIRASISLPLSNSRPPVQEALREACLKAKDIQMVEAQDEASSWSSGLDLPSAGDGPLTSNTSFGGQKPLRDFGVTGWVRLCRLGEYIALLMLLLVGNMLTAIQRSMASERLVPRASWQIEELHAVHLEGGRVMCCSTHSLSFGRQICSVV